MAFRSQHFLTLGGRVSWSFYMLLLILVVALGLRLNGINWDQGFAFHPDERDIYMRSGCMYDLLAEAPNALDCGYVRDESDAEAGLPSIGTFLDKDRSPLNPHWFPLGSILIYILVLFRSIVELFTDVNPMDMRYVGRPLAALADVGSVAMVFVLGRRFYGTGVGLLAAGFTSLAVIHIQNSHFFRPETFSVFFTLVSFWAMWRMVERKQLKDSAFLGLALGLAIAPKISILPILAPLFLVYLYRVLDEVEGNWSAITPELVKRIFWHAVLASIIAAGVFLLTSPYVILDIGSFLGDISAQTLMARNAGMWPFTIQYIDTLPFIYQIQQSSVWGLGIPLGMVSWISIPFTVAVAIFSGANRRADLFVLAWVVPYFVFLQTFEVHFLRYVFPLMPIMIIMGSRMLIWMVTTYRPLDNHLVRPRSDPARFIPYFTVGVVVLVVAATAFYSLAFQKVYENDHPAVAASKWINENIPKGTLFVSDNHWDEFVPNLYSYNVWQFPVYEEDNVEKMNTLADKLAISEYLVFYSNRPYSSAARDPDRFPFSTQYYKSLFDGSLGYELDRLFTNYPELFGVSFRDDAISRAGLKKPMPLNPSEDSAINLDLGYADDNVVGYDHPTVLLFKNNKHLDRNALGVRLRILLQGDEERNIGLMLSDDDLLAQQSGGTFSEIVDRDGWVNKLPVLAWILVVEIIYLAALPLTMFIFRPLPDRGIILARIFGLLVVSYIAWLVVSVGWMDYSRYAVYLGLGIVTVTSLAILIARWRELKQFIEEHWKLFAFGEVLFLLAFLAFVMLRYANPDLWHPYRGGEKPMELAYLSAVLRSTTLPPFDPWFAGGYLNYYYWGYFVISNIIRISGILPATAFNLAVPLLFALTLTGAYTLVYNLTEGVRQVRANRQIIEHPVALPGISSLPELFYEDSRSRWKTWLWSPVGAGLMAGMFTAVIGNLDGIAQILQNSWNRVFAGTPFPAFDFWRSSRMLPNLENIDPNPLAFWVPARLPGHTDISFHISEFPFFTFLFADLHPHMMVIPLTLLVIGFGLNLVVGLRDGGWFWTILSTAALALGLGSLWVVNSWDFPSYLIITLGLLSLAVYFSIGTKTEKIALLVTLAIGVVGLSILAFLPFHQTYETFNTGLDVSKWRTPVDRFLAIHGLFLFIIASFLTYHSWELFRNLLRNVRGLDIEEEVCGFKLLKGCLGLGVFVAVFFAAAGFWTISLLVVFVTLAGLASWKIFTSENEERRFSLVPLLLLVMAFMIGIGVDLVRIDGDIGRMNTFFKYYLEIWILLSIVSAYMFWNLGDSGFLRTNFSWSSGTWLVLLAVLISSTLMYTALGTRSRISDRFPGGESGLNGTAYMSNAVHREQDQTIELKWDQEAMEWMQDKVKGSPVILEAHLDQYHWGARFANYTGLPTVIGWPWHQMQQRESYSFAIHERVSDVREVYQTADEKRAIQLLRKYHVKFVVVGDLEKITYPGDGFLKFENIGKKVFENQGTTIFQIVWN